MKNFFEWWADGILEGTPVGWQPSPMLGQDPILSLVTKVLRAEKAGHMPFNGNFMDSDVIVHKFGLTPEEAQVLRDPKNRLMTGRPGQPRSIDKNALFAAYEYAKQRRMFNQRQAS